MTNSYIQNIINADIDAVALSQFTQVDANTMIPRRLAPAIKSLDYYLQYLEGVKSVFTQETGYVTINGVRRQTAGQILSDASASIERSVNDARALVSNNVAYAKSAIDTAIANSGFITIDSFEQGATITQRNQALRHTATGKLYRWAGDLPKVVPVGSTPTSSGGVGANAWLEVNDVTLRQDVASGNLVTDVMVKTIPVSGRGVNRSQSAKNTDAASVKDFGAIGDGEHHPVSEWIPSRFSSLLELQSVHPYVTSLNDSIDWLAFQAATEYGGEIHIPRGTYYLNKKVSMRRNTLYKGLGIKKSAIVSYVSNDSLFQLDKSFIFGGFIDLGISTHSSVSLSSGHGIDALGEATGDDESHTPQYLLIERCQVTGFKGTGRSPSPTTTTTAACGLIQSYGVSTRLKQSLFDANGAGVYLYSTSTSRIESCSFATNTYWGLYAELNTNLVVSGGNFVHNGTGVPEVAQTLFSKSETGNVGFFGNYGSVFTYNKTKGTRSTADIVISNDEGTVISQNNIRGAYSLAHDAVQCIYVKTVRGLVIDSNTFHGINITETNASATATYKAITFKPDSLFHGTQASVCDNTFRGITASRVGYFVGLIGSNSARKIMFIGMVITGNNLANDNRVAPWSIDTAILLKDCRLKHSTIANNTCYVSSTLTIDSVINFSNVYESDNVITGNSAYYAVTTAVDTTANIPVYKGVVPDKREYTYRNAAATQILANAVLDIVIDAKNTTPTELVYVETIFSIQTPLTFKSWISEAGKITIRVSNNSDASVTLPTGYFNVLLKRASRMDVMDIS